MATFGQQLAAFAGGVGRGTDRHRQRKLELERLKLRERILESDLKLREMNISNNQQRLAAQLQGLILKNRKFEAQQSQQNDIRQAMIAQGLLPPDQTQIRDIPQLQNSEQDLAVRPITPGGSPVTPSGVPGTSSGLEGFPPAQRRLLEAMTESPQPIRESPIQMPPPEQLQRRAPASGARFNRAPSFTLGPGGFSMTFKGTPANVESASRTALDMGIPQSDPQFDAVVNRILSIDRTFSDQAKPVAMGILKVQVQSGNLGGVSRDAVRSQLQFEKQQEQLNKIKISNATKSLTGQMAKDFKNARGVDKTLQQIRRSYRPAFVGKGIAGPFRENLSNRLDKAIIDTQNDNYIPGALPGAFREFFGRSTPEETRFRRSALQLVDDMLRARSGAAINESEAERIKSFALSLYDEPGVFETAFNRILELNTSQIQSIVDIATKSPGELMGSTVRRFSGQLSDDFERVK